MCKNKTLSGKIKPPHPWPNPPRPGSISAMEALEIVESKKKERVSKIVEEYDDALYDLCMKEIKESVEKEITYTIVNLPIDVMSCGLSMSDFKESFPFITALKSMGYDIVMNDMSKIEIRWYNVKSNTALPTLESSNKKWWEFWK